MGTRLHLKPATLLAGLAAWGCCGAGDSVVTPADIERARQQHRMPSEEELARVPIPRSPRIDALPQPSNRPSLDLEALAKGFEVQRSPTPMAQPSGPRLLVFISLGMPKASLQRLVTQAAQARATLVLRGLHQGSMQATVARMHELIGSQRVAVQIDPTAFDRYGVVQVPTFVLARGGRSGVECAAETCAAGDRFAKVAGDVSLGYAHKVLGSWAEVR